jgi:hypothetical protein
MGVGWGLDRALGRGEQVAEDFPFWCYLFGLMAFWGGLTATRNSGSEVGRLIYLLINFGLIGIAIALRRSTFLVFGAMGAWGYVGHLAYTVFKDSVVFPRHRRVRLADDPEHRLGAAALQITPGDGGGGSPAGRWRSAGSKPR